MVDGVHTTHDMALCIGSGVRTDKSERARELRLHSLQVNDVLRRRWAPVFHSLVVLSRNLGVQSSNFVIV